MSKAANIYWDKPEASRRRTIRRRQANTASRRTMPWWLSFVIFVSLFAMLLVSINFRAFTEMREETSQNARLSTQIQNLQDENLALQEEIHGLKTNREVIQREVKRLGLRSDKVLGSAY